MEERERLISAAKELARELARLIPSVESVIVGGSVLRGDFSPGFSDIDVYVFVRLSDLTPGDLTKLREIVRAVRERTGVEVKPDVFFVEELRILLDSSMAVNDLIEKRMVLHGRDVLDGLEHGDLSRVVTRVIRLNEITLRRLIYMTEPSREALRRAVKLCLSTAKAALVLHGVYVLDKREVVKRFKRAFPQFSPHFSVLDDALRIREEFSRREFSREEIEHFMVRAYEFVRAVRFSLIDRLD